MQMFTVAKGFNKAEENARESEQLKTEADSFQIAGNGGYIVALKYALFVLFGFYNVRLFITTVLGWEGYLTAAFALAGEATALYCFNNYTKSTGKHKTALGVFALLLFAFSFTHASISFFKMEHGNMSGPILFYCERVAFPLLFGLLLLAAVIIPLMHWRADVAAEQAAQKARIEKERAKLVGDSASLRNEAAFERERLNAVEERIQIGNQYLTKLKAIAAMKREEKKTLTEIDDPELQRQLAVAFGLPDFADTPVLAKQKGTMTMAPPPQSSFTQSGASNVYFPPTDEPGK